MKRPKRPDAGWLSLLSLNISRGLHEKIGELEEYLAKNRIDVAAIQEADGKQITAKGYKSFMSKDGDVLFLVALHLVPFTTPLDPSGPDDQTPRQLWIKVAGDAGNRDLFLCCVHMPQEKELLAKREEAFIALTTEARLHSQKGEVVVLGDLNARAGRPESAKERDLLGDFGEHAGRTGNGKLLVQLLKKAGLVSLIGQTKPPECKTRGVTYWFTRQDIHTEAKHAIDDVLVSGALATARPKFWVDYTHLPTDHHALRAAIRCPRGMSRKKKREAARRAFRLEKMIQRSSKEKDVEEAEQNRKKYQEELKKAFVGFEPQGKYVHDHGCTHDSPHSGTIAAKDQCQCAKRRVNEAVADFIDRTNHALEQSVGSKRVRKGFSRSWFDQELREVVTERRAAYKTWAESKRDADFQKFTTLRKKCRKLIKKKKREKLGGVP